MHFSTTALALLVSASSALAITINTPSPSSFWVQNTSNTISWSFNAGSDPNPVNIEISNSNSSILNGNFSVAQFVDLSNGSFIVSNVTLLVATGYTVNFVNVTNPVQVFASSQQFEVKAPGTTPASISSASAASTATSASGTASGTNSANPSATSNAASRGAMGEFVTLPVLISASMALAGGLLVL